MRKAISKKLRFEIFKRDSFTCQYCGQRAPDVVLEADHVHPVAEGGDNDILNLVTSCKGCNAGKGARTLSDDAVVTKQVDQLVELEERRQQIEMMMEWKRGLSDLNEQIVEKLCEHWSTCATGWSANDKGKKEIAKLVKNFSANEVFEAITKSADAYLRFDSDGKATPESVDHAWKKIKGICQVTRASEDKPYLLELFRIRGVLRKRVYVNEREVMKLLETAAQLGACVVKMKTLACNCRNWTEFSTTVEEFIESKAGNAADLGE